MVFPKWLAGNVRDQLINLVLEAVHVRWNVTIDKRDCWSVKQDSLRVAECPTVVSNAASGATAGCQAIFCLIS